MAIGLVFSRSCGSTGEFYHCFVSDKIVERGVISSGTSELAYLAPLLKYNNTLEGKNMITENFTSEFRAFVDSKYKVTFPPEVILGYIYAVLYHKDYRTRYKQFLKLDFPRIPFIDSKDTFLELSKLGIKLISIHLMKKGALEEIRSFDTHRLDINNQSNVVNIIKPQFDKDNGRLYINPNLYFMDVTEEIWKYMIGGYQVLDKYLKSYKNEEIDISYYEKIIKVISKSLEIEEEIASIEIF